jgi:hypothetical protein
MGRRRALSALLLVFLLALAGATSWAQQTGHYVLDGFGGVHAGGAIKGDPLTPNTPYFGFNIARGIAARIDGVTGWARVA